MNEEYIFDVENQPISEIKRQILASQEKIPGLVFNYPVISVWQEEGAKELTAAELWHESDVHSLNLYIHIPFCRQKCSFCYYSVAVVANDAEIISEYLECLAIEAQRYLKVLGRRKVETVFIGGGTPSRLDENQINFLFDRVVDLFDLSECREITYECSPDSIDSGKLQTMKKRGVNRLSMGVQSLDPDILRRARRNDEPNDVIDAYYDMVNSGIPNVNIDLIAGIEQESAENMRHTMDAVMLLDPRPTQVTLFTLSVRAGAINHTVFKDRLPMDLFRDSLGLYGYAKQRLREASYWQYSRNLFPRENWLFHYQDNHWGKNGYVLALGASGYSHSQHYVYLNEFHHVDYMRSILNGENCVQKYYPLTEEESLRRHLVLAMKHSELDRKTFNAFYPDRRGDVLEPFADIFEAMAELGLIQITPETIRYTDDGINVADRYVRLFYSSEVNELINGSAEKRLQLSKRNSFNFTL